MVAKSVNLHVHIQKEDLNELEFPELLAEISPFAFSKKTADRIAAIRPFDIDDELKLMLIENFRLDNASFLKIKSLTEQIARLQKFFPVYYDLFLHLNNDV